MNEISTQDRILNARRRVTLNYYEGEIEKAGRSLAGIFVRLFNDPEKPWLCSHETLEDYLKERWNMTPRRKQQILAGEAIRNLLMSSEDTAAIAPTLNERQLREISTVPQEQRAEVLKVASEIKRGAPAPAIKKAKAQIIDGATGLPEKPKSQIELLLEEIEQAWSFDNFQQHTHSWHDKQDFMERWRGKRG